MRRLVRIVAVAGLVLGAGLSLPGRAEAPPFSPWREIWGREIWGGADVTARVWSVYAGQTWAFGGGIQQDGFRLRAVSGYGRYSYDSTAWSGSANIATRHHGTVSFIDVLLGYHLSSGPLTIKLFAGATGDRHEVTPVDLGNDTQGIATGLKLVLEGWLNFGDMAFAALDLSWASAHETSSSRLRLGWRLTPKVSAGIEGAHVANPDLLVGRAGLFLRGEWARGEASISGGLADDDRRAPVAYGTVNVMVRF